MVISSVWELAAAFCFNSTVCYREYFTELISMNFCTCQPSNTTENVRSRFSLMLFPTSLVKDDMCIAKVSTAMLKWWKRCRMAILHKLKRKASSRSLNCFTKMRLWSTKYKIKWVKCAARKSILWNYPFSYQSLLCGLDVNTKTSVLKEA